jgi:hypothetical protein
MFITSVKFASSMQEPDSPSGCKNLCEASGDCVAKLSRNKLRSYGGTLVLMDYLE